MEALGEERPEDLAEAYELAMDGGPAWRVRIRASLKRMPETKSRLDSLSR